MKFGADRRAPATRLECGGLPVTGIRKNGKNGLFAAAEGPSAIVKGVKSAGRSMDTCIALVVLPYVISNTTARSQTSNTLIQGH